LRTITRALQTSQKIVAQLFQRVLLTATQTVPLNSIQKRDRIGEEYEQITGGFSDKGQMI
jgi:uncharacterized protein YjfI (DUF2170 family)